MKSLLCSGLVMCLCAASAAAKPEAPTQGALSTVIKDDNGKETIIDLPLKHTEVEAEISGYVARVKVKQTFTNPCDQPIEAVYVFPLPQNAAVNDMQIRVGDRVIRGLIKKHEEARQIYEKAKQEGKTAALLEQERPNIFSQSVANLMPGSDIVVEITYDDLLPYEQGRYEFAFPMVVGPRYIPGKPTGKQAGGWAEDTDQVPDASRITPPVLKPGERNGHDIMVTVKLDAGVPVQALECPSHEIVTEPGSAPFDGPATVRLAPRDTVPNKDFVLRYTVAGDAPQTGFLAHRDENGGAFMLMFQPPVQPQLDRIAPKEMVFVLDCSGSMSGEPISLVKKAVRHALQNLNPDDTFQIIRFSDASSSFASEPVKATPANVRRGLSYVNGLDGEGGTEMLEGIKAALDFPNRERRLRIVCFMTDGYIGNEKEILAAIRTRLGDDTRLFSFGVGSSVNRYLLERMAEVGRGEVKYVLLNEKPEDTVKKFYERIRSPVLTHIRVDWAGLEVEDLYPARIPDLFAGQPVFVLGRYGRPGAATIRVHGKISGQPVTYELPVELPDAADGNAAVASLWARSRIRELSTELYGGEDKDVVEEITALALKHRLMSEYTSFVAVEEKIVNEDGHPVTIQVPVEMPEGVSYEGVFGGEPAPMQVGGRGGGLFFGAAMARKMVAPAAVAPRSLEADEDSAGVPEPTEPMKPFSIELRTPAQGGEEVLRITEGGEIWLERGSTERMLLGRLTRRQARELWALLAKALKAPTEKTPWTRAAELHIRLRGDDGQPQPETRVETSQATDFPPSPWKDLLDYIEVLRAGF
ncbi:MAG TPA: VIT domain-containing protein [Kiritimatiellia bacterium]|nr:VIT domain-containing protein [Kiritimatiellia bacterium]HRZ13530.1 VIT domain-containing protein [Kiritimatiellia bacterium]HSA19165.1 VIT domain-containing protein [Kiritimatiellia bacterium]